MPRKIQKERVSEHDIEGHSVRIVRGIDREELWIDGKRRRFFKNSGGYVLADNAYVPAEESLLEAVRLYLRQAKSVDAGKPGGVQ